MKKRLFANLIIGAFILSGCDENTSKTNQVDSDEVIEGSVTEVKQINEENAKLLKDEIVKQINFINESTMTVGDKDLIVFEAYNKGEDNTYVLHTRNESDKKSLTLNVAKDYEFTDETTVEIPLCINDSDEVRFLLKFDLTIENDYVSINDEKLVLLNEADVKFNEVVNKDDITDEDVEYIYSLFNDEEEAIEVLKTFCKSNNKSTEKFLRFIKFNSLDEQYLFEVSLRYRINSDFVLSEDNFYIPKVYGLEQYKDSEYYSIVSAVTKHAQTGVSFESLGFQEVEPNWTYEEFLKLESDSEEIKGELEYHKSYVDENKEVYHLDFDGDGLLEVLFLGQYSVPNKIYEILELDENGKVTETGYYSGRNLTHFFKYDNKYFFVSEITDYSESFQKSVKIYAKNQDTEFVIDEIYETIGYGVVSRYKFNEHSIPDDIINSYVYDINSFKESETYPTIVYTNNDFKLTEEIIKQFFEGSNVKFEDNILTTGEYAYNCENYNLMDMNNDGVKDLVLQGLTRPATNYLGGIDIMLVGFIDGKTKNFVDISMDKSYPALKNIDVIKQNGENYFILLYGDENIHDLKIVKFEGLETILVETIQVVDLEEIHITEGEN